jgi:NAD+ synthase (glutamine-hydrolysing)
MKVTVVPFDSESGKVGENGKRMEEVLKRLSPSKSRLPAGGLVVFPELALSGYFCLDLFLNKNFLEENRKVLEELAEKVVGNIRVLVGFPEWCKDSGKTFNSVALLGEAKILQIFRKRNLPNYDIFSESRYFAGGTQKYEDSFFEFLGKKVGVQICEDLWDENYSEKVTENLVNQGVDLVVNLSASPFRKNFEAERRKILAKKSQKFSTDILYVNGTGSGDAYDGQVILDGGGLFYRDGECMWEMRRFSGEVGVLDLENLGMMKDTRNFPEIFYQKGAIVKALQDYRRRTGLGKIMIGMSGGVDSALVAVLAVEAFGADAVMGYALPSRYSSSHSLSDAEALAKNLEIGFEVISIEPFFKVFMQEFANKWQMPIVFENAQARIRGIILMGMANEQNALLLSTTNKTEMALGYGTLYGDMCGGMAPIGDLNKLEVYAMCRWISEEVVKKGGKILVPENTLTKAPSAELAPGQSDEKSLGADYEVLSPLVDALICGESPKNFYKKYGEALVQDVVKRIKNSEHKRRQAPPAVKVGEVSFGLGRRVGIST